MSTTRATTDRTGRRIDVTGWSLREVRDLASRKAGTVHVERRRDRTYVVTE